MQIYDGSFKGQKIDFPIDVRFYDLTVPEALKIDKDILNNKSSKYSLFPPSAMKVLENLYSE